MWPEIRAAPYLKSNFLKVKTLLYIIYIFSFTRRHNKQCITKEQILISSVQFPKSFSLLEIFEPDILHFSISWYSRFQRWSSPKMNSGNVRIKFSRAETDPQTGHQFTRPYEKKISPRFHPQSRSFPSFQIHPEKSSALIQRSTSILIYPRPPLLASSSAKHLFSPRFPKYQNNNTL